jgi:hypothetical protein
MRLLAQLIPRKGREKNKKIIVGLCSSTFLACLVFFLAPVTAPFASASVKTVANYKVSTMGISIGDVTTTQHMTEENGDQIGQFETKSVVKASFLWMGYNLDMLEKGALQKGSLISYSRKGQENESTVDIEGRLDKTSFRFNVREHGTNRTIVIPRDSYDYTTMECPEARLDFSDKPHITLRVLDVEKMAVVKRDYHLIRNTQYHIGGKELPCRIVDFSDRNKKSRRWITWDGSAVIIFRQDAKGEKNSYSVQATSVTKEM